MKPPTHGRVEYLGAVFGCLALRIIETGQKPWSLYYRMGKRLRRFTHLTTAPEADTFAATAQDHLVRARRNTAQSTFNDCKRVLEREFVPSS